MGDLGATIMGRILEDDATVAANSLHFASDVIWEIKEYSLLD